MPLTGILLARAQIVIDTVIGNSRQLGASMKGYLTLTEGRSGSNWIGSLANATGQMGMSDEWADPEQLGVPLKSLTPPEFVARVLDLSSTDNGRFGIKIFPRHLQEIHHVYGLDFVRELVRHHDLALILLTRRDRLRQAVSFAKARMTNQWRSDREKQGSAQYDFDLICRCYFYIERSYAYWRSYLQITALPFDEFEYENLVEDVHPFLFRLAQVLDVATPTTPTTELRVQRDEQSEEWLARFREDVGNGDVVGPSGLYVPPSRKLKNAWRLWKKRPMTPIPMNF